MTNRINDKNQKPEQNQNAGNTNHYAVGQFSLQNPMSVQGQVLEEEPHKNKQRKYLCNKIYFRQYKNIKQYHVSEYQSK